MKDKPGGWQLCGDHVYDQFKIFEARRSTRVNPRTGRPFDFFLMRGLDWVNVIPLTPENEVVLVRQYRHGAEVWSLEIPGGCIETGEEPAVSGQRELLEETGFTAATIEPLGVIHANPAMMTMQLHTFLAHGCIRTASPALDPGEDIEVLLKPLPEVLTMVRRGEISHALVVAAFGLLSLRGI